MTSGADGRVIIDVGEDETGTLAAILYRNMQDDPENFVSDYDARFYLFPEGTSLPFNTRAKQLDVPGLEDILLLMCSTA